MNDVKLYTLEEAAKTLPLVKRMLKDLRIKRDAINNHQTQIDVERVTGASSIVMHRLLKELHQYGAAFHEKMEEFHTLGIELKDLDEGLVDFYTMKDGKLAYLCWKEGEKAIGHWHSLDSGYSGRKPL